MGLDPIAGVLQQFQESFLGPFPYFFFFGDLLLEVGVHVLEHFEHRIMDLLTDLIGF